MLLALHLFFDRLLVVVRASLGLLLAVFYNFYDYFYTLPHVYCDYVPANGSCWARRARVGRERLPRHVTPARFGNKQNSDRKGQHPGPAVSR